MGITIQFQYRLVLKWCWDLQTCAYSFDIVSLEVLQTISEDNFRLDMSAKILYEQSSLFDSFFQLTLS